MTKNKSSRVNVYKLVILALFTALVFVSNFIRIPIATPVGETRIHLGNVFCLLSALMLGPLRGGAAAGLGSMLYDFMDPVYISSAPFTLLNKFVMAFVCGLIAGRSRDGKNEKLWKLLGGTAGALAYVFLYSLKNYIEARIVTLLEPQAAWLAIAATKLPVSLVNAAIAVFVSVPLSAALSRALRGKAL